MAPPADANLAMNFNRWPCKELRNFVVPTWMFWRGSKWRVVIPIQRQLKPISFILSLSLTASRLNSYLRHPSYADWS
jgi:hypothetical protein